MCGAFTLASLDRMLRFRVGKDRAVIVEGTALDMVVFNLIGVARREGWLGELVRKAHEFVPGSAALSKFVRDIYGLDLNEVLKLLDRKESVNVVVPAGVSRGAVGEQLAQQVAGLAVIHLENPATATRPGLLGELLRALRLSGDGLGGKPEDLTRFAERLKTLTYARLAITQFDIIGERERQDAYGTDLFHMLRYYTTTDKKLGLVLVTWRAFGSLLPADHPLSHMDITTVELRPAS
jgi:hypothetical protein